MMAAWPQFNPGALRFRGTLQVNAPVKNPDGGTKDSWASFAEGFAFSIVTQHSRQYYAAQQLTPEITLELMARYIPGVKAKMRIAYGVRIFDIKQPPINVDERDLWLQLFCSELP